MMSDQPTRILIIEDHLKIVHWLEEFLQKSGFEVFYALDGRTGVQMARGEKPEVIILDLMLPDVDGFDVCRKLREHTDAFIIMLTARVGEADRLAGLEIGADDYVTKPFNPQEVVARIRALLRRARGQLKPQTGLLSHGGLTLDAVRHLCTVDGEGVSLTPTEFALLETLMRNPGVPFTRERLIAESVGYDYSGLERTIDVHVRNLRRKIEADPQSPRYVETVFGVGYRFTADAP
jgi:two-component system alkaline phosphatase synthesis response regulator PhoP